MVSSRNRSPRANTEPWTLGDRIKVGVSIAVVALMAALALGNHFFDFPPSSPDMTSCEMSGYCGPQYPYWE